MEEIKEFGACKKGSIQCLTIVGQIEGHQVLPEDTKATKYEHILPLIAAVEEHRAELIEGIEAACHHYKENRINPTDKSILLIAMAEIKYFDGIPPVVSVSEATGLARKYSTEKSADFVNGVLSGVINKKVGDTNEDN